MGFPCAWFLTSMMLVLGSASGTAAKAGSRLTIAAVGDLMCHDTQLEGARQGDGHDFRPCFAPAAPILARADLAVGNLETVLAGPQSGYTGYPMFNSPDAYARALREAGFDVLTLANNHTLDRFSRGILRTAAVLDGLGFLRTGTGPLQPRLAGSLFPPFFQLEDADYDCVVEVKGVRIAFLAFTGLLNFPLPEGVGARPQQEDRTELKKRLDALRALPPGRRPDLIAVSAHWGNEYQPTPTRQQRDTARWLAENGVDLIIGSHPHILQGAEVLRVKRGGEDASCLVFYSLGNFISGQRTQPRERSAIAWIEAGPVGGGRIGILRAGFVPVCVRQRRTSTARLFEVLPAGPPSAPGCPAECAPPPGGFPFMPEPMARSVENVLANRAAGIARLDPTPFLAGFDYRDPLLAAARKKPDQERQTARRAAPTGRGAAAVASSPTVMVSP